MAKTVAVIDGNSLMHRAYHAVPPSMNAPDGTPTNAAFGFLSMLLKFIEKASPDALICAFDAGRPAFRTEALEQYKAQRPPMDEDLKVQFPLIEDLLKSMNIPVVRVQGWEGDDILGTIASRDERLGFETLLVSGDKDIYQLASDHTRIVTTKKGISDVVIYGPQEVQERYGVSPSQVPDFLGLKGDPSDNIPGVPGIGEKTAAKLLQAYGNLEGLYDNLDKLRGKQLENVRDNKDLAFTSRRVATIVTDLDFDLDVEKIAFPSFDAAKVTEAFENLHFYTHLRHVLKLISDEGGAPSKGTSPDFGEILHGKEAQDLLREAIEAQSLVGVSYYEDQQTALFGNSFIFAFSVEGKTGVLNDEEGRQAFADLVRNGCFAAFDVKETLYTVFPPDTSLEALLTTHEILHARFFDVNLAAYILDSSHRSHELALLAREYLSWDLPEKLADEDRVVMEAASVHALVNPMKKALSDDKSEKAYFDIDLPLVSVLALMERSGAAIDVEALEEIGRRSQAEIESLRAQIFEITGEEFNLDSPKQLSHMLFEVLGYKPIKKTKSGYSTDNSVLKELSHEHEVAQLIIRYRELTKIKSTYIDALPKMRGGDGLLHTTFHETITTTGRLSSSDPNLQNIPVRTDFGRHIRDCFVPINAGEKFLSADYSQIELRLLAHLSGERLLIDAFNSGADFHAHTASRIFGCAPEDVTPQMRSRAKAVNFGIVYGQQAYGLAQSLEIPFGEAQAMIDRYFEAYPGVKTYLNKVVEDATEKGYAETMFGRKRHIPELRMRNRNQRSFGERTAMNHPMQGSAADIIKLAMRQVAIRMEEEGFKAQLILQVHDELDFSVPENEIEALTSLVKDIMEHVVDLDVSLDVDVEVGDTWAEAH